jgi:hypothetical protein
MLKLTALVCCVVSSLLPLWAQSPPQIDASSQPAVATLRAVAQAIKECPASTFEGKKEKGLRETIRLSFYPPENVVWDVVPRSSVRSPYLGYIEFSLRGSYINPSSSSSDIPSWDTPIKLWMLQGAPVKHRYEFDLGPGGLELSRMLHTDTLSSQMRRERDNQSEFFDDSPDGTCWQNAGRNVQAVSNQSAAIQTAADVAATSVIGFLGSAFLLRCDTDEMIRKEACKLWLNGLYNGLATTGPIAGPKDAASGNVICFPETPTNDQLFDLILKYIKDHPAYRDRPTAFLALVALQQAFPCKQ